MNNEVEKIKEDIIKECCKYVWCSDCPYSNDDKTCSAKLIFNNRDVRFTLETTFLKLFKKAIIKECKMAEECDLCKKRNTCAYCRNTPCGW